VILDAANDRAFSLRPKCRDDRLMVFRKHADVKGLTGPDGVRGRSRLSHLPRKAHSGKPERPGLLDLIRA
jgi:hypothetical protein